ncbi:MAG TPA: CBS domain-containing protein [Methylomirabilota bacterium]|jgi:CBS domain-containing protein|nr:CBS domain-containing protein [Methylomirabilota bacterium]
MPDLSIRAWMTSAPPTIGPKESVKRALAMLRTAKVAELLVMDEGRVVGMVGERDIWEHCPTSALLLDDQQAEALLEQFRVGGVMALHPPLITPATLLPEAAQLLAQSGRSGLPVVEDGMPVGFLTEASVLQAMALLLGADQSSVQHQA